MRINWLWTCVAPLLLALALLTVTAPASAFTVFSEDFDGYTSFPSQAPSGDFINPGLPKTSEGADETWYGIRFQNPDSGTIDQDLAVQRCGDSFDCTGPGNQTPVGRFEDEAGLVFSITTVGLFDVELEFDWRTFSTGSLDRVRVGYFASASPIPFDGGGFLDARSGSYAWSNWTQLMSDGSQGSFEHESFALPSGVAHLYVAFWLDNGEGDYGKLDNVLVTAVPEPGSALLVLVGAVGLAARRQASGRC